MIIKVCGMRDGANIRQVEALGIDWMGFICWPERVSRYVVDAPSYLPYVPRVGVFVNPTLDFIRQKVQQLGLSIVQLHGQESPEFCQETGSELGVKVIKAISISCAADIEKATTYESYVDYFLFDTKSNCVGGSGHKFDWQILENYHGRIPFLLAGGISPEDAEEIKTFHHPKWMGIDLNSRFETSPAMKDTALLDHFIKKIR